MLLYEYATIQVYYHTTYISETSRLYFRYFLVTITKKNDPYCHRSFTRLSIKVS